MLGDFIVEAKRPVPRLRGTAALPALLLPALAA
jgi:hypothetical protein